MLKKLIIILVLIVVSTAVFAEDAALAAPPDTEVVAEEPAGVDPGGRPVDFIWLIIAAVLVFFMQAGFAMVETGFTRAKNSANILMKNLLDYSIGSLVFFLFGWGIMYGPDLVGGIIGWGDFGVTSANPLAEAGYYQYASWLFQVVFAATAATIVSGAMAERTKFKSYLIYSVVIAAFIYPVTGHWIWGGGWLSGMGFIDFAGSTAVHSVGGWAALAGAIMLGPRIGKYGPNGKPKAIAGHNLPLAALGVFILWFGWFGFNAGSTLAFSENIGHIAVTTNLAAAAGAVSALITIWIISGKPDASMALNGVLAGLVAITAPCADVSPNSAIIIGLIGGVLVVLSVLFIDRVLKIDDPVGAVSVHGVCGVFGTLAVGLFAEPVYANGITGLFTGISAGTAEAFTAGINQLGSQALGVVTVAAYVLGTMFLVFFAIKKTVGLRVSKEEEIKGLDIDEHGMEAYSGFQILD
ncbi:MAG: ammonium transporter [Spirochaetales bacterium]|nr:ammonium transporter [Spirochaetales bacterium]